MVKRLYLYEHEGDVMIVSVKEDSKGVGEGSEAIIVYDDSLLTYNQRTTLQDGRLESIYKPLKESMCLTTTEGKKATGFLQKGEGRPTQYSLMGTGILGIAERCISPNLNKIRLRNPLVLSTPLHVHIFQTTARKTLIYTETGHGLESVVTGWNIISNFTRPLMVKGGSEKLSAPINPSEVIEMTKEWHNMWKTKDLIPSPVYFFLFRLGYDSVVDQTTHIGIKLDI